MFGNYGIVDHSGKNRLLTFARTVRHVAQLVLRLPNMHELSPQHPCKSWAVPSGPHLWSMLRREAGRPLIH